MNRKKYIEQFDKYADYTERKIQRDIDQHRKGEFVLKLIDRNGKPIKGAQVKINQISHEFKFGCSLFLLDQFKDESKNEAYKNLFLKIFNYGVVPLYWDTLEPERGNPRFEKNSPKIWRRPPLDVIVNFCRRNNVGMKGHCLMYNSFNPEWMPQNHRALKMAVEDRVKAISERYSRDFTDLDVINEMFTVYKNCYGERGMRNYPITDDKDHEKWCFDLAKQYFPHSTLHWNEGLFETFGSGSGQYTGNRSVYYLMLKNQMALGTPIGGIGMQFHAFCNSENEFETLTPIFNPLRLFDVFETYDEFRLPIHISEVSIPSWSNSAENEELQAQLVERLFKLWFGRKNMDAIVWWNLVDGTAYESENLFHAGLLREDMSKKPAYEVIDHLINNVWHTSLCAVSDADGNVRFNGFYGTYELNVPSHSGVKSYKIVLDKDNTGYDNTFYDFKINTIALN